MFIVIYRCLEYVKASKIWCEQQKGDLIHKWWKTHKKKMFWVS